MEFRPGIARLQPHPSFAGRHLRSRDRERSRSSFGGDGRHGFRARESSNAAASRGKDARGAADAGKAIAGARYELDSQDCRSQVCAPNYRQETLDVLTWTDVAVES